MGGDQTLRVDPAVMRSSAASLGGAAEHLLAQLAELDKQVGQMLGGWSGAAGSAYGSAWELWHRGAQEVQAGLALLGQRVAEAGAAYQANEVGAARAMRAVRNG